MGNSGNMQEIGRAFWAGLTRPSLLAVALCLGIVAGGVLAFVAAAPVLVRGDAYRILLSGPDDAQTFVSHHVARGLPQDRPSVVVLGTSLMVACMDPWNDLDATLGAELARPVHVAELATSSQTSWEMAAILDATRPPEGSIAVIGLSYGLLGVPVLGPGASTLASMARNPKMAFTSPVFDAEIARAEIDPPRRTGVYALDNAAYFLARRKEVIRNILRGGISYADPLDAPWYAIVGTPEAWEQEKADLPKLIERYNANVDTHFDALDRMIARESERGVRFVIALAPINPEWDRTENGALFMTRYRAEAEKFARGHGLPFADLNLLARLGDGDFVDMEGHLKTEAARDRCTAAVGEVAANAMGRGT